VGRTCKAFAAARSTAAFHRDAFTHSGKGLLGRLGAGAIIQRSDSNENATMALLKEGEAAPGFSVPNQDGEAISFDTHAGKTLVLWWYPRASTPG